MSKKTQEFKTEIKQMLDLIIHSMYSHKEIFLRELISNACDAIDKVRFESITNEALGENNTDWKIKLTPDAKKKTLTISDNGIGMSAESIVDHLGTIAKSGTSEFLADLQKADAKTRPELIGQFGVGFYSAFMVADKITVESRAAGDKGVRWVSDGQGEFTVEDIEKETRGTDIILHMRKDEKDFYEEWQLRQLVRKYSDFIEHPIVMDVEKEDDDKKKSIVEETLNTQKAIWIRTPKEIADEEYNDFYKHISNDYKEPLKRIHYSAEGAIEFRALMFIPSVRPFDMFMPESKVGLHLYIRRVFIMDECKDLLPPYLRFVKGVVDSADLPLNVSRELLQQNAVLNKIRKNLVGRILKELAAMAKNNPEDYRIFYKEFGEVLKEGIHTDLDNKDKIANLLLFETMNGDVGKVISLKEYVAAMPKEQEDIYFLTGEERGMIEKAPYLETFRDRKFDVLFLMHPIDEFVVQSLPEYDKKKLKAVNKGELPKSKVDDVKQEEATKTYKDLIEAVKGKLADQVKDVRITNRLKDSASCLVSEDADMGAHMERLMKKMGQDAMMPGSKRILELNPEHPVMEALQNAFAADAKDPQIDDVALLLYEQAVIAEGSKIADPAGMAARINKYILKSSLS